jgi:signal transduction histidine kinase
MNSNSLALRLLISAAAWIFIIVSITALILISIARDTIEDGFDQRLNQYLDNIVGLAATPATGGDLKRPDNLGEPNFAKALSGYYWQIRRPGKNSEVVYSSESLVGESYATPTDLGIEPNLRQTSEARVPGPEGQLLRVIERQFTVSSGNGSEAYAASIALDTAEADNDVEYVTSVIALTLGMLGLSLLIAFFFLIRFGLSPFRDLQVKLSRIRSGDESQLTGDLPSEIKPLQDELNALIQANASIVERARTHVGNLAHALKTPLSVILNEADAHTGDLADKVKEQATIMRQQVSHYLDRARIAAQVRSVSGVTDVNFEIDSLSRALRKIYQARGLNLAVTAEAPIRFAGEKQDFEEMAGNLMDNACKWARAKVDVVVLPPPASSNGHKTFTLIIDDDGPGLPEDFRNSAVKRGRRLDETVPGSGLGLSIVADLSELYQGSLVLEQSPHGGLRARLTLPAA